jgi:hypothetical protein
VLLPGRECSYEGGSPGGGVDQFETCPGGGEEKQTSKSLMGAEEEMSIPR